MGGVEGLRGVRIKQKNLQQLIFKKNNGYLIATLRNNNHFQMNTLIERTLNLEHEAYQNA